MPEIIYYTLDELPAGETKQRIQVFPGPGDYVHPSAGPFTLTADVIAEHGDDINARGDQISIDYDHSFKRGNGSLAAGWYEKGSARVEDSGALTAEVDWTPAAAQKIRDREYRFISPEFSFAHQTMDGSRIQEPKLHATALTNRPFFTSMPAIAADEMEDAKEIVADAFGVDVAATLETLEASAASALVAAANSRPSYADPGYRKDGKPRYLLDSGESVTTAWKTIARKNVAMVYDTAQLSRIKARIKRAATKFGVTISADETKEKNMPDLSVIAASLDLAADASEEDILTAATKALAERKELEAKVADLSSKVPSDDQMKTLIASAAKGEKAANDLAELTKNTALDTAVKDLKIAASERDTYAGFWDIDPVGVAKLLTEKQPILATTGGSGAERGPVLDAAGKPLNDGTVTADLTPQMVDGAMLPVGEDRATLHAAAMASLSAAGKNEPTEDEYVTALLAASTTTGIAL